MTWLIAGVIFALTAGFAKLSTILLNRLLAIPQPKWVIGVTELVQLSLIPIYGLLLVVDFRQDGVQSLFQALTWNSTDSFRPLLVTVGGIGLILLIRSSITYQLYRPPVCQFACESRRVDFRQATAFQPWQKTFVGPRPMRRIALLPGNEQFSVEVATKTFLLPRIPPDWDGLSIVQIADTHFRGAVSRQYFEAVCEQAAALKPDVFVFTGDLLDDLALLDWLPKTLGRLKAPEGQFFILGNHDWYLNATAIRNEFTRSGWTDVASRSHELSSRSSGPGVLIAGDETPWMGSRSHLSPELKDDFRILLSHTPDNIDWARTHGIDLMLAGHTHGGQIRLPIIGPVYSPSRYGCRFASGAFWMDPTLLYVSRGLSGREPVRYNCTPELTKIVLTNSRVPDKNDISTVRGQE